MDPIYLDYAASTPVRPEVRAAMDPYLDEIFGNPSSSHSWGRRAQAAIEESRGEIAELIGARRREIYFVRGGTESDNLAIMGRAEAARAAGAEPVVAVSAIEHKAVLDTAGALQAGGGGCITLPVDGSGILQMAALDQALLLGPACVSCMWVNNEVGVIQPMAEIAHRCSEAGVPLHSDAVQAVGKLPIRVDQVPVSILSISAHKLYGPKSAGAIYVREGTEMGPRLYGGGQESGLRPGTQDVSGIVGMAVALRLAIEERDALQARLLGLRERLEARLRSLLPEIRVNGRGAERAAHILNVGIPDVNGELLMVSLDLEGIAVSGGAACNSGSGVGSHVLEAIYGDDACPANVRFSFGRSTTEAEVDRAAEVLFNVVGRMRDSGLKAAV